MVHQLKNILLLVLFNICGCFITGNALASESFESATNQLQGVQKQIRELRTKMSESKGEAGRLQTRLALIEIEIGQVNKGLENTTRQLQAMRSKLRPLKQHKQQLLKDLLIQKQALANQLRAAYVMGRQEQLKLLLNQQNPSLIGRTLVYYEYFNNSRTSQIDSVDETLETLQSLEKDINRKTHDLQNLSVRLQGQKQELESTRNQRHSVLSALNKELKQQDKTMNSLLDDEIELQRLLKYLETVLADIPAATQGYVPFSEAKGRLAWPIQGHVRNLFGTNRSNSVANLKWQGVIIESELGQDILAIADGQVAFSDWMPRYGLLIIINHGHGYMSLYGHNQSLYKSVGEWVEQGELIAKLGDSGGQATPGLYFEIRHNSKPLNPTAWCSSKVKMSKTSYN